jgi:hypothetical protein
MAKKRNTFMECYRELKIRIPLKDLHMSRHFEKRFKIMLCARKKAGWVKDRRGVWRLRRA